MTSMSPSLTANDKADKAILKLAQKDGEAAGKAFVAAYGLGQNDNVDALILEGLETNVSLVIQRLPWASVVPQPAIEGMLSRLHIPENIAREVVYDVIWTYMATYDQASRKVIRDAVFHGNPLNRKG